VPCLLTLLLLALPSSPIDRTFAMSLRGERIGLVRVRFDGAHYRYESVSVVRRGSARSTLSFSATTDAAGIGTTSNGAALAGPLPSTLALWRFVEGDVQRCLRVEDERDGKPGTVCGTRRDGRLEGTLLGEPFQARVTDNGPEEIAFIADQVQFERVEGEPPLPSPRDLFARSAPAGVLSTLIGATQARIRGSGSGCALDFEQSAQGPAQDEPLGPHAPGRWEHEAQALALGTSSRWSTARTLAHFVEQGIASTASSPASEDPAQVWRDRKGSCLGQAQLFAALARGSGVPTRVVYGALLEDGQLSGHAWDEVQVRGQWFGVDPSRGRLPVGLDHLPMAREGDPDPLRAGRCLLALPTMIWEVEARGPAGR
jgi:transglutaminase-like putative cysteine protease